MLLRTNLPGPLVVVGKVAKSAHTNWDILCFCCIDAQPLISQKANNEMMSFAYKVLNYMCLGFHSRLHSEQVEQSFHVHLFLHLLK